MGSDGKSQETNKKKRQRESVRLRWVLLALLMFFYATTEKKKPINPHKIKRLQSGHWRCIRVFLGTIPGLDKMEQVASRRTFSSETVPKQQYR